MCALLVQLGYSLTMASTCPSPRFMNIMTNNSLGQVANLRQVGGQYKRTADCFKRCGTRPLRGPFIYYVGRNSRKGKRPDSRFSQLIMIYLIFRCKFLWQSSQFNWTLLVVMMGSWGYPNFDARNPVPHLEIEYHIFDWKDRL